MVGLSISENYVHIQTCVFGTRLGSLTLEYLTDMLSRNGGKDLPLHAA